MSKSFANDQASILAPPLVLAAALTLSLPGSHAKSSPVAEAPRRVISLNGLWGDVSGIEDAATRACSSTGFTTFRSIAYDRRSMP